MLPLAEFLSCRRLPLFSPQQGDWSFCSLMECKDSPAGTVGSPGSLCTVGGRLSSIIRVVDCHSLEELGFQLLDRKDVALCRDVQCEVLGFCVPWGNRPSGAACSIAGCSFPPFSGESGILTFSWRSEGSLTFWDSGECWASVLFGEGSLLASAE
jgi:hypothetical protein